ncbi:MAG: hypothetical protein CMH64_01185 [Nanoarchaeota archaeon]|nr:hypothetical protein [Nanoarchaeota archaeon]|tara:strand:- start:502 stop:951 length:450 start_codon:yes stop_codon:yes gene_type:complete
MNILFDNILRKEVKFFAENHIDAYRGDEKISIDKMVKIYLNNGGFFVLCSKDDRVEGYLDFTNVEEINKLMEDSEKIKENLGENKKKLNFRNFLIKEDSQIKEAIEKFKDTSQLYFPVIDSENRLTGRVSLQLIKTNIDKIYGDVFKSK